MKVFAKVLEIGSLLLLAAQASALVVGSRSATIVDSGSEAVQKRVSRTMNVLRRVK